MRGTMEDLGDGCEPSKLRRIYDQKHAAEQAAIKLRDEGVETSPPAGISLGRWKAMQKQALKGLPEMNLKLQDE